jgi:hypothetical protein
MTQLFQRAVWVIVDDLQVKDLRVAFKVTKTLGKEPNSCEVTITNLSETTRARLRGIGSMVGVFAGYGEQVQQLFSGAARRINHIHERPEWHTTVECGDGEQGFLWGRVSESFKAGTRWKDVVRAVAKSFVTDQGNLEDKLAGLNDTMVNGYTAHGRSVAVLDKLLKGRQLSWSIQDGRLQLLGPGEANTDSITVLTPDTGLVGSPAFCSPSKKGDPDVLKVRALLQPQLRPGSRIRIQSGVISGQFRVSELRHEGDTHGQPWYTDIEAHAL